MGQHCAFDHITNGINTFHSRLQVGVNHDSSFFIGSYTNVFKAQAGGVGFPTDGNQAVISGKCYRIVAIIGFHGYRNLFFTSFNFADSM